MPDVFTLIVSLIATTLTFATPITLGALSGIACERAGVVNIAIEGMMLAAAFGGLRAGATRMQFNTQVPSEIIAVIQGLILLFIAADVIVRRLYRLPSETAATTPALTSGWGEK